MAKPLGWEAAPQHDPATTMLECRDDIHGLHAVPSSGQTSQLFPAPKAPDFWSYQTTEQVHLMNLSGMKTIVVECVTYGIY